MGNQGAIKRSEMIQYLQKVNSDYDSFSKSFCDCCLMEFKGLFLTGLILLVIFLIAVTISKLRKK